MRVPTTVALALFLLQCSPAARRAQDSSPSCPEATEANARLLQQRVQTLKDQQEWSAAVHSSRCLLSVGEQVFGSTHPTTLNLKQDLSDLLCQSGAGEDEPRRIHEDLNRLRKGEDEPQDQTAIWERIVESKSRLARGDARGAARAVDSAKRFAAIEGMEHSLAYAAILNEEGRVLEEYHHHPEAIEQYRASAELARQFGPEGRDAEAVALNNLGRLELELGQVHEAQKDLERSVEVERKSALEVAARVNLGQVYETLGQQERARRLYLASRDEIIAAGGAAHPSLNAIYIRLTAQEWKLGNLPAAVAWQTNVNRVVEANVQQVLGLGSEEEKLAFMAQEQKSLDASVDLCAETRAIPAAAAMAFEVVLQRKGRVLSAYAASLSRLRERTTEVDAALWRRFVEIQRRRSASLSPGDARDRGASEDYEKLLAKVGTVDAAFDDVTHSATMEAVRAALPERSVLLEFVAYRPQGPSRARATRYAVFALSREGLQFAALEDEATLLRRVRDFRAALKSPRSNMATQLGHELHTALLSNVAPGLKGAERLFVSPDGLLNLVPFAALVDDEEKFLVDTHSIDYLTSGRSLLRQGRAPAPSEPPLVVVNPDYGSCGSARATTCRGSSAGAEASEGVARLCETRDEARAIVKLLPDAQVLDESAASEERLMAASSPRILHIATHGYFGADLPARVWSCKRGMSESVIAERLHRQDPQLLSGLVLAGAQVQGDQGDGLLNAREVATMNLTGTQLVVLSACETALGDARRGEGVFGLRRAFELAGAASQVMTLWKVSSDPTAKLLVEFYSQLGSSTGKVGVADALTLAQRQMLHGKGGRSHPHYWAGLIASGDWRPLELRGPSGGRSVAEPQQSIHAE